MLKNFFSKSLLTLAIFQCAFFSNLCAEFFPLDGECCKEGWWHADVEIYGGYIFGESKEIVDNPASNGSSFPTGKISELTWKIRDLWVIGGTFHKAFFNIFHITLDGWLKAHAADSTMVDNDWLNPIYRSLLTDQSRHPDTRLENAESFTAELGVDLYEFDWNCSSFNFQLLGGYEYLHWHWKAYGGTFVYNEGYDVGTFSNVLVIGYKQNFHIPYLGLKIDWEWDCFGFSVNGKYSWDAKVSDHDFHALRNVTFTSKFNDCTYWIVGGEAYWTFYPGFDLNIGYTYEKLQKRRGNLVSRHYSVVEHAKDFAKIGHWHQKITLGITAHF